MVLHGLIFVPKQEITLETKINFQNAVTFVLVKLDTKFNVHTAQFLEKSSLTTLHVLNFNIFLTI